MKDNCILSIIIPVHNTASYLERCIESVRNQTLKDIEIILVENASTDESPILCDKYAQEDIRVQVVHLDEAGPSNARNVGIDMASASYIGFVDSDDYIEPTMFEDIMNAIEKYQADIVYCNFLYEYEDGQIKHIYPNSGSCTVRSSKDVLRDIIMERVSSSPCTKVFKRNVFETLRFPRGMFFEDHATVYRWFSLCDKIVWLDTAYYHYVQRGDSTCHTLTPVQLYHYFLAEYDRLEFVIQQSLFEGQELYNVINLIVGNCFCHFNAFMSHPQSSTYPQCIKDMRKKLRRWLSLDKKELVSSHYKRLRKITYFWPIYYWTHFSKKNKGMKM